MTLRTRLRRYLGLGTDHDKILVEINNLNGRLNDVIRLLSGNSSRVQADHDLLHDVIAPGIGRLIAKADFMYGASEHDPVRVENSKAIGEEVIRRLEADAKARKGVEIPGYNPKDHYR